MKHNRQFLTVGMTYLAGLFSHAGYKEKHERSNTKAKKKSYRL